jgi:hypothetical protein
MTYTRIITASVTAGVAVLMAGAGWMAVRAQDPADGSFDAPVVREMPVSDPQCTFFGPQHDKFVKSNSYASASELTDRVMTQIAASIELATAAIPSAPGGSRTNELEHPSSNTIDRYIFDALTQKGVAPAPPTTDFEFVRRVYLDLTGRIPAPAEVTAFVNDSSTDKRSKLIDGLIGSANWVDKWTVWYADLFKNNSRNTQIARFMPGVLAFNTYIRDSLTAKKPYDQMARELIAAQGADSYSQGELNFLVGGVMGGGPIQDIFDAQIAFTTETFLGLSHMNCLLCHNGRGHLDQLSLWGYYQTRQQAWGMASFMSHTMTNRAPVNGAVNANPYYWALRDDVVAQRGLPGVPGGFDFRQDYQLNTQTGNRPARGALNSTTRVAPAYIFDGSAPARGEDYRTFLGKKISSDFLFAQASVNYVWEYFFGVGLAASPNQLDPYRLDPDNPPMDCPGLTPCTLQASNPRLLNALAHDFVESGYDIRALQREIVNSRAYQLSSRYAGAWDVNNTNLFARKLVRRLWSEEIHDAVVQSSNVIPTYSGTYSFAPGDPRQWGPVSFAMKFPEPFNTPNGAAQNIPASTAFLDAFLRGNRDDEDRKGEGSISQALGLMNDNFVMQRVRSTAATSLIQTALKLTDDQLVDTLYLTVLSRYPTSSEKSTALGNLRTNRTQEAQNLLWSLYNSVSFTFNY